MLFSIFIDGFTKGPCRGSPKFPSKYGVTRYEPLKYLLNLIISKIKRVGVCITCVKRSRDDTITLYYGLKINRGRCVETAVRLSVMLNDFRFVVLKQHENQNFSTHTFHRDK